jgi:L-2-hydroxycarboxylate dehydrogenase (NAD+)
MEDILVDLEELIKISAAALSHAGFPADRSVEAARVLVEADARGIRSHGVVRLARYLSEAKQGFICPEAEPEVIFETPVSFTVDGNRGLGQHVSIFSMERCIKKAESNFLCFATVRNSNHYGIAGYYSEMAQKKGMMGISMTNTYPLVVPTFGCEAMLGTNPIAVCIPGMRSPFHMDMATSVVPRGKIEVRLRAKESIPEGWAVDENGNPTEDAVAVIDNFNTHSHGGILPLGGAGEEFGGHKGFGLATLVDLLTAGLSLGQMSRDTYTDQGGGVCHFFGAIRLDAFGDPAKIRAQVQGIIDDLCNSAKSAGNEKIFFHGEKELTTRAESMKNGIKIPKSLFDEIHALSG